MNGSSHLTLIDLVDKYPRGFFWLAVVFMVLLAISIYNIADRRR